MKYIPLEDLEVFKQAMALGDTVWEIVDAWNFFSKRYYWQAILPRSRLYCGQYR